MSRILPFAVLLFSFLPSLADAATVRVRPGLWSTSSETEFTLPVRLSEGRAVVPSAEWRPLAACLLASQDTPSDTTHVRCARVQVLALEHARSQGQVLSDDGARWVQWHHKGTLDAKVRAAPLAD